jgi:hypothetical protein
MKTKHGGLRSGAGRPISTESRSSRSFRFLDETSRKLDWLAKDAGLSMTALLERMVENRYRQRKKDD